MIKHGLCRTVEYGTWLAIKNRCYNKNYCNYKHYGGRGITVCDRWKDSFENFLADMGVRPVDKQTLDRVDNSKGYSPDNCKWATWSEQQKNRRNWLSRFKDKKDGCDSKYRGVSRQKGEVRNKPWRAYISTKHSFAHLGGFDTEIAAAKARDRAVTGLYGDKAILNFPKVKSCVATFAALRFFRGRIGIVVALR